MVESQYTIIGNPKAKAPIWRHFGVKKRKVDETIVENTAVCLTCNRDQKCAGGMFNLTTHTKRHHPTFCCLTVAQKTQSQTVLRLYGECTGQNICLKIFALIFSAFYVLIISKHMTSRRGIMGHAASYLTARHNFDVNDAKITPTWFPTEVKSFV